MARLGGAERSPTRYFSWLGQPCLKKMSDRIAGQPGDLGKSFSPSRIPLTQVPNLEEPGSPALQADSLPSEPPGKPRK